MRCTTLVIFAEWHHARQQLSSSGQLEMGAVCFKSAHVDAPEAINESLGPPSWALGTDGMKEHASGNRSPAALSHSQDYQPIQGTNKARLDRDAHQVQLGIESKSSTIESRSASSAASAHHFDSRPDLFSTVNPHFRPQGRVDPFSPSRGKPVLATASPLLAPPREQGLLAPPREQPPRDPESAPTDVAAAAVYDSVGDIEDDGAPVCNGDWIEEPCEATAALHFHHHSTQESDDQAQDEEESEQVQMTSLSYSVGVAIWSNARAIYVQCIAFAPRPTAARRL
jgi:hypothetical protein